MTGARARGRSIRTTIPQNDVDAVPKNLVVVLFKYTFALKQTRVVDVTALSTDEIRFEY